MPEQEYGLPDSKQTVKDAKAKFPQLLAIEFAAWIAAATSDIRYAMKIDAFLGEGEEKTKELAISIAQSEKQFAMPVFSYIQSLESVSGWRAVPAAFARYLGYVWIDATATSGIVGAMYGKSLQKQGKAISYWNLLYPLLVAVPGAVLKLALSAVAVVVAPVLGVLSGGAYMLGFTDTAKQIAAPLQVALGLLATVLISNINPVIALKTLSYDTRKSARVFQSVNSEIAANYTRNA